MWKESYPAAIVLNVNIVLKAQTQHFVFLCFIMFHTSVTILP